LGSDRKKEKLLSAMNYLDAEHTEYRESGNNLEKKQNCMVQVADLLRSNGIRWSQQAESPRRHFHTRKPPETRNLWRMPGALELFQ
jgi:hypothetical protein